MSEIPEASFQFEQALRLKPDYAEARIDYARLLAQFGDLEAARNQLKIAANSSDAEVRRGALELLQQLRR